MIITEKSTVIRETINQYVFEVSPNSNKVDVAKAVEKLFKVKVDTVRIINVMGKKVRVGKSVGQRRSWKKAVVKLSPESKIQVMEGL
ncbi:MAG: 50S ribosomal protein L23 [Deltaproteobacteria bacterium]